MGSMTITGTLPRWSESNPTGYSRVWIRTNTPVVDTENDVVVGDELVSLDPVGHFAKVVTAPGAGISPSAFGWIVSSWNGRQWARWQVPAVDGTTVDLADVTDTTPLPVPPPPYATPDALTAEAEARAEADVLIDERLDELEAGAGQGNDSEFVQAAPLAEWIVTHSLGRKPAVTLFLDDAPDTPVYTDISYPDLDTLIISLPSPMSGVAYLS